MVTTTGTIEAYEADFESLDRELRESQPQWLGALRRRAFECFRSLGFPTARKGNEPWKYTNVAPIAETRFSPAPSDIEPVPSLPPAVPLAESWLTLVLINGRPAAAEDDGVFRSLARALAEEELAVRQHLAAYASVDDNAFAALNTAFIVDGAYLRIAAGSTLARPLHIVHYSSGGTEPYVCYPRTLIVAGRESRATVVETYAGPPGARYFSDPVTEIVLEEGAQLHHTRLLLESVESFHVGITRVYQNRDSIYRATSFEAGGALARHDLKVTLDAAGAEVYLNGLYVVSGAQHIDNYVNIDHAKPHGTSRLYYKGILDDQSRAVFGGTVFVRPGAVKTDAHQEDKNLLLSKDAEVDSKPSLEIYADDVKCGHGATAGAVAEDALFYIRSRGIDPETANVLLIKGFAAEILDTVKIDSLRTHLEELTLRALPRFNPDRRSQR
jgi:Fe-S cluster assembly protein SufD